ncbi:hypothetical protein FOL47_001062 [Perkinsus chesapeaki]|uniref:Thymus-specific serine protease n=1 Tax=Perkinsus chesapeaki TaxID=330153 RepID=A0A7J6MKF8_PERCH|nr:hypothetical protein FOL47_001062 [Perkinsus chesapeaki]
MRLAILLGLLICIATVHPIVGLCDDDVKQLFGYLPGGSDAKLFYWFFESRHDPIASPTLIFFQGGPGGSSMYSLTSGNGGPCILNRPGNGTSLNVYSYNTFANVMYIDQPSPTGFSEGGTPTDSVEAAKSTFLALSIFFNKYPIYNTAVFYIGQSYAGHFIPPLASFTCVYTGLHQYEGQDNMQGRVKRILEEVRGTSRPKKDQYVRVTYDLSKYCTEPPPECEYLENYPRYFNSKKVQRYLGVHKKWKLAEPEVDEAFNVDPLIDYSADLAAILDGGLRVMIYAGDQDYICNWIGNRDVSLGIQWSGHDGFSKANDEPCLLPNRKQYGEIRRFTSTITGGQLSFARIFKAGHNAAKDSPAGVLKLVSDFVMGRSLSQFVV